MQRIRFYLTLSLLCLLTSCYFHPRGEMHLSASLHKLYLQSSDPYGLLARQLQQYLKMSHILLVSSPDQANAILTILQESNSEVMLGVSSTQQTRQYNLVSSVSFEVSRPNGQMLIGRQTLSESRVITIQSNQVLGSSNEKNLFYQQMQRALAYSIMNRLASQEVTKLLGSTS